MSTILFITYILIFLLQIVLLVKAVRSKSKKLWVVLFLIELVSMLAAIGLKEYYDKLPGYGFMPGLTYIGEVLFSFGASVLYGVFFLGSACVFIVKEEKKKNIPPFFALAGFLLWVLGIYFLGDEIINNYDKTKSTGTVIGFEEVHTGGGIEQWPVIEFTVGEECYQQEYPMFEGAVDGKEIKIYYYPQGDTYKFVLSRTNNKLIYAPALLLGCFFWFRRRKHRK